MLNLINITGKCRTILILLGLITVVAFRPANAGDEFIHPGGLHKIADLDRMKAKVAAGEHPWIDSWKALSEHPKAQSNYTAQPFSNMDSNRQRASADAVAAYLNAIRWYISGDTRYADCAVRICNAWSGKVNEIDHSFEGGLMGIPAYEFAVAGEVLRLYPGWRPEDFARFKNMMLTYVYPSCHDYLERHDDLPVTHYWANWDLCNMIAVEAIGVLCDDRAKFDEAIEYFKNGKGNGSIKHAIPFVYEGGLAQWQESGRDSEHTQLGVGMMAMFCQIAWNQGIDLFSYDDNRFLKAAEYVARYSLWEPVPYTTYNNEDEVNQYWPADYNGVGRDRGRLQRPIWELIYNHYGVLKGLKCPSLTELAALYRPEAMEHDDNFGFGTLLYTLDAKASPYPPAAAPPVPQDLAVTARIGSLLLTWSPCKTADGYIVYRAASPDGPFKEVTNYRGIYPVDYDSDVTADTTYYYRVAARNVTGTSEMSKTAQAMPAQESPGLPDGWTQQDIGDCAKRGSATHADVNDTTITVSGSGWAGVGVDEAKWDGLSFVYQKVADNFTFTARRISSGGEGWIPSRNGIMIRDTLAPTSKMAAIVIGDLGWRETRFGGRVAVTTPAKWQHGSAYPGNTPWFRLKRIGVTITAYESLDGIKWYQVAGPIMVPMSKEVCVGLAVSSNNSKQNKATFDHIKIEPMPLEPLSNDAINSQNP